MSDDLGLRFPWTTLGNAALFVLLVVGFAVVGSFFGPVGVIAGIAVGTALSLKSFAGGMNEGDARSSGGGNDCPECGRSNDPVANYCQHCGTELPGAGPVDARDCPACGAANEAAADYCHRCGTELPVPERDRVAELRTRGAFRYCGKCGARVRDDPDSCPGCGREFV